MFDTELASVVAIFAGIAALIAYINERTKRRLKVSTQALKIKKMPGTVETEQKGLELEEWNFPKAEKDMTEATVPPVIPTHATNSEHALASTYAHPAHTGTNYQELETPKKYANGRTLKNTRLNHSALRTRTQLREAMITMTVLGPCRALAPFTNQE